MDTIRSKNRVDYGKAVFPVVMVIVVLSIFLFFIFGTSGTSVSADSIKTSQVKYGLFVKKEDVIGTLVPIQKRLITADQPAVVEKIIHYAGSQVGSEDIVIELSNPDIEQEFFKATQELESTKAEHESILAELRNAKLNILSKLSDVEQQTLSAELRFDSEKILAEKGIIPLVTFRQTEVRFEKLKERREIEIKRLDSFKGLEKAKINSSLSKLKKLTELVSFSENQMKNLMLTAKIDGVVQQIFVKEGQRVLAGDLIANIVDLSDFKAELKVAESKARDIAMGNVVDIDTRSGMVEGVVARIDPAVEQGTVTVDVKLLSELPSSVKPDQRVFGTIKTKRKPDVLYIDSPALGKAQNAITLYKLVPGEDTAVKTRVMLGELSSRTAEVTSGLRKGDIVIVSDTSQLPDEETIYIKD